MSDHAENNFASVRMHIVEVDDASSWSEENSDIGDVDLQLAPAEEEDSNGGNGLGHHGDPEPEVEVVEEAEEETGGGAKVLKAPRSPTQAEIDAHLATHLPHADWCELCMKGRGRNTPHRRKKNE